MTGIDPNAIAQGGTVGLILGLIVGIVALATGMVRPGSHVKEAEARTDRALEAGTASTRALENLTAAVGAGDAAAAADRALLLDELRDHRDAMETPVPGRRRRSR